MMRSIVPSTDANRKMKTEFNLSSSVFFLDIDGTLAELQDRPAQAFIPLRTLDLLQQIQRQGAQIALISGRPLREISAMTAPLKCTAAGAHGAECRDERGRWLFRYRQPAPAALRHRLERLIRRFPGVTLENKGYIYALHYRLVKEFALPLRAEMEEIAGDYPHWILQQGKCVYELKPGDIDKGSAIARLMRTPSLRERYPIFIGDDHCDEAGFAAVNRLDGLSIKVGPETTVARWRLPNVTAVCNWLDTVAHPDARQTRSRGETLCHA